MTRLYHCHTGIEGYGVTCSII
uniref:Uncharacterized protein n=1 Tax=Arundo donax TaxID=35708 RepID=A0A0A9C257_ARUDO